MLVISEFTVQKFSLLQYLFACHLVASFFPDEILLLQYEELENSEKDYISDMFQTSCNSWP